MKAQSPSKPLNVGAVQRSRQLEALVAGTPTKDGAGVKLRRVLTQQWQQRLDPFLMLDHFGSDQPDDYIAGFPDHPHRGFETITLMLAGRMRHRDSAGHEGVIDHGGVQWMTAARGIIHSETPEQTEGQMDGFQLWLNLHSTDKMGPVAYRDIQDSDIPRWQQQGVTVRVIAGQCHGVMGAVQRPKTTPLILDIQLNAGTSFQHTLQPTLNAFLYIHSGQLSIQNSLPEQGRHPPIPSHFMAVLSTHPEHDGIAVQATEATRFILVAGQPLHESIAQQGPFIMNTRDELRQAVFDYHTGRLA